MTRVDSVDTSAPGVYTVAYSAIGQFEGIADALDRTVNVKLPKPEISDIQNSRSRHFDIAHSWTCYVNCKIRVKLVETIHVVVAGEMEMESKCTDGIVVRS